MMNYWSYWSQIINDNGKIRQIIATITASILVLLWYKWILKKQSTPPLPPGPRGLPLVGYLPFLGSSLHEIFTEMANRYGPIFKLQLGTKLLVVVNSLELASAVTRDHDHIFSNRDPPLAGLAITYDGNDIAWKSHKTSHWRKMRKLLVSEVLSHKNLKASHGFRRDEVRKTIKNVYAKIGSKIDINEIAYTTEYNVITSMLWGRGVDEGQNGNNFGAEYREVQFKIIELLGAPNLSDFFPILARFDLQGVVGKMKKQLQYVDTIFNRIIAEKIASKTTKMEDEDGRKDLLDILLELKDQKDSSTSFNLIQIKALLVDILTAGTDTTTTMLEWVMAELLNDPRVMKKVQDEMTEVVGITNSVEESHMPKLQYLAAVIKETFRLHPALPLLIQRCPDQSCIVGEYTIPKGSIVYMNVWAIHRDPRNWEEPLEFKPERFLKDDGINKWDYNGNNHRFFPFGSGRRICPGIPLAEKMLMFLLASFLHLFEWRLPSDEKVDLSEQFGFVLKKRKPLVAIASRRLSNETLYL